MKTKEYMDRGQFRVEEFENPNGKAYRVYGWKADGTRVRQNFKTYDEAFAKKQELEIQASNSEAAVRQVVTRLTQTEVAEVEPVVARLKASHLKLTLAQVLDFALENYREPVQAKTLKSALDDFITERTAANDRPLTIRNLKQRVGSIVDTQPDKQVSVVMEEEIKGAIFKSERGPVGQDNERRALLQFFNWATKKGYCAKNPVAGIAPIKIERETPEILPLSKVRALLAAANEYKDGAVLPYVALSLFAGIRPTELTRLTWANIKLDRGTITIDAKGAKMRSRRVIEMAALTEKEVKLPANLAEWLLDHAAKKTPIVGKNWRKDLDYVKEAAGLVRRETAKSEDKKPKQKKGRIVQARRYWKKLIPICWCPDILRHTAISNHYAWTKHEGETATWAGNSPDMIHRHYKGLVEPEEAKEFWNIRPSDAAQKIVKLRA
jgi:integrase